MDSNSELEETRFALRVNKDLETFAGDRSLKSLLTVNTGSTHLGRTSPWPSCPSFPFPHVHTSVLREGRSASASPLYVGVRTTVRVFTRAAFLSSLGETETNQRSGEGADEEWGRGKRYHSDKLLIFNEIH